MRSRSLVLLLVAGFLTAAALSGQDWRGKGRVEGYVKDAAGQVIEMVLKINGREFHAKKIK